MQNNRLLFNYFQLVNILFQDDICTGADIYISLQDGCRLFIKSFILFSSLYIASPFLLEELFVPKYNIILSSVFYSKGTEQS